MTTPAITELLEQHRALIESRAFSFDEKVGYLVAASCIGLHYIPAGPLELIDNRLAQIREALSERNSARLRELNKPQPAPEQPAREPRPARDLQAEIDSERVAIAAITRRGIFAGPALENLQLHINRLVSLEKKVTTRRALNISLEEKARTQ